MTDEVREAMELFQDYRAEKPIGAGDAIAVALTLADAYLAYLESDQ